MRQFRSRSEMVLYVWDYFYISNVPAAGDDVAWAAIERAVCRIYESDSSLDPRTPPDVRLRSARRVRNAARLALRQIAQLSVEPEHWVIDRLADLVAETTTMIETLSGQAANTPVH